MTKTEFKENTSPKQGFESWKQSFYDYYQENSLEDFILAMKRELETMGWPEEIKAFSPAQFSPILSTSANYRIRLIAICDKVRFYRDELKERYDNMLFFLKADPDTQGKIKEDKKKYAELELEPEKQILRKFNTLYLRTTGLIDAYKIQYEASSRLLSIAQTDFDQLRQEP